MSSCMQSCFTKCRASPLERVPPLPSLPHLLPMALLRCLGSCLKLRCSAAATPNSSTDPVPLWQRASGAFAFGEFGERSTKIGDGEIWPALFQKNQFGKRTFPKKKVGQALLAAGADQQI